MAKIQNNRKADITIRDDEGRTCILKPGLNEDVPSWVGRSKYAEALHDEGEILVVEGGGALTEEDIPDIAYKLDSEGNKIQATDEKGDPVFDEVTGEPVYVPADAE